jgi:hypothetical protein
MEPGASTSVRSSYSGACLCGRVRLLVSGVSGGLVFCHCRECRRSSGSAFIAVFPVPLAAFALDDPHGLVREYRASTNKARCFCAGCGSPLFSRRDGADNVRVRAGLFEALPGLPQEGHIFTAEAAVWCEARDELPRYPAFEPGRDPGIKEESPCHD